MHPEEPCGERVVCRRKGGSVERLIIFCDTPADTVDFIAMNYFFSNHPASSFLKKRMVNLSTLEGSISIDADVFRERKTGIITERKITSEEEFTELLEKRFGIRL